MKRKISIHDLARELGVSAATISYVLNGRAAEKRISADRAKTILEYVAESGYRPNRMARSLRTGKSKIIGMLVEDISDPFFSGIARIVEAYAHQYDYKIFHASTENNVRVTRDLLQGFRDTQVDGYIIAPPPCMAHDIAALLEDKLPVVLFDRYFPELDTHNIVVDNKGGAYQAALHLLENGYTHIGFVTLDSEQTQMDDRLIGYASAMEEQHLPACVLKVSYTMEREKQVAKHIGQYLDTQPQLDALIFATNYLAIAGLEALHGRHRKIPDDMAVVGFDDNTHFALFSPSVSAVAQPVEAISKASIAALMTVLSGEAKALPAETTVLPTQLIVRQSSLPRTQKTTAQTTHKTASLNENSTSNLKLPL
jgi:LacI family transcriptional regulator